MTKKILIVLSSHILICCFASVSIAGVCTKGKGDFEVSVSSSPDPICIGEEATVSVTITNTGDCADMYRIVPTIVLTKEFISKTTPLTLALSHQGRGSRFPLP